MPVAFRPLTLIPTGLGDRRVANWIYRRHYVDTPTVRHCSVGGARFELHLEQWPEARSYLLGRYDPATVEFVIAALPQGGIFVDGGAHVGLVSFQVAHRRPDARVFAFEPHPVVADRFRRHVALNQTQNVNLIQTGLSDQDDTLPFDFGTHAIGGGNHFISVTRLDNCLSDQGIDHVDVLKLDVEGHELRALRGASGLLDRRAISAITMEALHGDTDAPAEYIKSLGYQRVPVPDQRAAIARNLRSPPAENVAYRADSEMARISQDRRTVRPIRRRARLRRRRGR